MSLAKLCFGQVRHARLQPSKNAFTYSVFTLRIPMRQRELSPTGITQTGLGDNSFSCLSFFDKDHGNGNGKSLDWALNIAESNGITDIDGEVWLQTFPRVLGYVFNPVSFWFFQNKRGDLRAIIAEVNNTFGERHSYLICDDQGQNLKWGQTFESNKVFHVSPFCETTGKYFFRFFRAENPKTQHVARIEYHHQGPVLITSVNGDQNDIRFKTILWAMIRYPAMSFGVIFRIHWQALKLWIKGVQFHRKPNPPATEVSK